MIRYIEQNGARALEYRPEPQQRHGDTGFPFDNRFSSEPRIFPIGADGAPVCVNDIVCTKRAGGSYIYSNNPEMLAPEDVGAALLRSEHMRGRYMFTFEHSNYTGKPFWLGYQLYNAGDTPVTATVYNIGYQNDGEWLGQRSWSDYFNLEFRLPAEYFLPDGSVNPVYVGCDYVAYTPRRYEAQQVTVPPGEYIYLFGGTTADAYAHTDIGGTADRPVGAGKCCNGAMLFELEGGDPTCTFYCYDDPAQVQAAPTEQGYIVTRNGKNYAAQYKGVDHGSAGLLETEIVWAVGDATQGAMPVRCTNRRDPDWQSKSAPYAAYAPQSYTFDGESWLSALNPNTSHEAIGDDMMVFACVTPDGKPVCIDNEHADGSGRPANTGNWMVQYTDAFTFINAGTKTRRFRIYKKGAVSGALAVAVRDEAGLDACLASDVRMVFTLFGDVCSIPAIVDRIRAANKFAVVHLDRVTGLASKEVAVDFIRQSTRADGVISTHTNLIQYAKSLGLFTVLRAFLIDSIALDNLVAASRIRPDALDILPGLMPPMIRRVREQTGLPVLTGGLITQKSEIMQALEAGALAISTTDPAVWSM